MRQHINFEKLVNKLMPHYMSGRKIILFLQAMTRPLQDLNEGWVEWSREAKIDASMTSQIGRFEWYLNRRLGKYITGRITLRNSFSPGTLVFYEGENYPMSQMLKVYNEDENQAAPAFHVEGEESEGGEELRYSFIVSSPEPDTTLISKAEYDSILRYYIEKYRIANKTYTIKYHDQ